MRLGAHCVLFGPAIASDTEGVIGKLAFAGAEGCELGEKGWAIVEYELVNFDENSYLRAISYLKGIRDML